MTKETCEICAFKNPKATATAVIIQENKLLILKRNEEPFKGGWDLVGGFMQEKETPEEALKREVEEELGIKNINLTLIKHQAGTHSWKGEEFPILSHVFLAEIGEEINLNKEENSEYKFVSLKDIRPEDMALDSNKEIVAFVKEKFTFDIPRIKDLVAQLDSSAIIKEQSLYKAVLDGFVSKIFDEEKLIGFGWIFPRQTLLRKQAVVEDMIIDNAYRGKGLGEKMLLELLDWAKREGMDTIELTTNPARIAANSLYQKVGFKLHPTNHYLYFVNE